jgi:hypothetical protein
MSNKTIAGAPEEIRTPDPQIRSLVLYPAELRARRATLSMTEFRKSIRGPDRGAGPGPGPGGPARRAADAGDPDAGRNQMPAPCRPVRLPRGTPPPGASCVRKLVLSADEEHQGAYARLRRAMPQTP